MTDAHLHLCFDGSEPRSSLHVSDGVAFCHDKGTPKGDHQDQDLDPIGAVLAKKDTQSNDLDPILGPGLVLVLPPAIDGTQAEFTTQSPLSKLPYRFLPLSRGPPA